MIYEIKRSFIFFIFFLDSIKFESKLLYEIKSVKLYITLQLKHESIMVKP